MKEGWIKTYRKIQDCWIWLDKEPFDKRSAWIDLLLTANHSDKKILFNGELMTVERGQILTSVRQLSSKWKWSNDKVLRFLRLIESDGMIKKQSDNFRTLLTIENYEVYQDVSNTDRTEVETRSSTRTSDKQECKECKEYNICTFSTCENDEIETVDEQIKKEKKKSEKEELEKNFSIIYNNYPKKVGRAKGFDLYKGWLKGRDVGGTKVKLTNRQIWLAIEKYKRQCEENGTDKQYIKQFDTFMNKAILDYVEEE